MTCGGPFSAPAGCGWGRQGREMEGPSEVEGSNMACCSVRHDAWSNTCGGGRGVGLTVLPCSASEISPFLPLSSPLFCPSFPLSSASPSPPRTASPSPFCFPLSSSSRFSFVLFSCLPCLPCLSPLSCFAFPLLIFPLLSSSPPLPLPVSPFPSSLALLAPLTLRTKPKTDVMAGAKRVSHFACCSSRSCHSVWEGGGRR